MNTMKVLDFINNFKGSFPKELEWTFYNGYCYWFALILATRFSGEIWFNPKIVHFATMIDDDLYDIYGRVEPGICPITGFKDKSEDDWVSWLEFQYTHYEAVESIVNSCIKKI